MKFLLILLMPLTMLCQTQSATAVLNINLHPVQSIMVNPNSSIIDINYNTPTDYVNGVVVLKENHLSTFSTGGFTVTVKANSDIGLPDTILSPYNGFSPAFDVMYYPVNLTTSEQLFFSSGSGSFWNEYNVEFKSGGGQSYLNNIGTHSTTIIYTINPF